MNYFLIGMMGAGKTAIGKLLSKEINYNFIDLDNEIEKTEKMKINKIFDKYGESYFRKLEVKTSRKVIGNSGRNIIATGGGFPINRENFEWMQNIGNVIYLKASPNTIFERIKLNKNRPLLINPSIGSIEKMLSKRIKYYEIARYHIDTNNKSVDAIVYEILNEIINYKSRKI